MGDQGSVRCPECGARLSFKGRDLRGRKVSCPKCSKTFAVPAAAAAGEDDEWLSELEESSGSGSPARLPPARRSPAKPGSKRKSSPRPAWLVPAAIGGGVLAAAIVALLLVPGSWFGMGMSWDEAVDFCKKLGEKRTPYIACRPRPNGNTPAGRGQRRDTVLETTNRSSGSMRGAWTTR